LVGLVVVEGVFDGVWLGYDDYFVCGVVVY